MKKKITILLIGILLTALPVLAIVNKFETTTDSEKCSSEIEELKLCVENSKVAVNSDEPISIRLTWVNTSDADRRIGSRRSGYSVIVIDKNNNKLTPVFEQRLLKRQERIGNSGSSTMTEEDIEELRRTVRFGSDRGLYAEANGVEKDEIRLADVRYDYDLTAKGNYSVIISRKVPSLEEGKTIEFVVDNIEIEVK